MAICPTLTANPSLTPSASGVGHGKVILFGEHAVLYGSHAMALPWPKLITARVTAHVGPTFEVVIPSWQIAMRWQIDQPNDHPLLMMLSLLLQTMDLAHRPCTLTFETRCPRGSGVGGSAAFAVAAIRALASFFQCSLSDQAVNHLAYQAELLAHGQASGLDNTMATYGQPCLFTQQHGALPTSLHLPREMALLVAFSGQPGLTKPMVQFVARRYQHQSLFLQQLFERINGITLSATVALRQGQLAQVGQLMHENHMLLQTLGVSCPALDQLVEQAMELGALGAKLTGGGGGGAVALLCMREQASHVQHQLSERGYRVDRLPHVMLPQAPCQVPTSSQVV